MTRLRLLLAALLLSSLGTGCTTPTAAAMRVTDFSAASPRAESLGLHVSGGWKLEGQVTREALAQAVEESLVAAKVFSQLVELDQAVYRLDVVHDDFSQPPAGFNLTVDMHVLWSLSRVDTGETVWQQLIRSKYTAQWYEAYLYQVRLRRATEGAARANIREALVQLSKWRPDEG